MKRTAAVGLSALALLAVGCPGKGPKPDDPGPGPKVQDPQCSDDCTMTGALECSIREQGITFEDSTCGIVIVVNNQAVGLIAKPNVKPQPDPLGCVTDLIALKQPSPGSAAGQTELATPAVIFAQVTPFTSVDGDGFYFYDFNTDKCTSQAGCLNCTLGTGLCNWNPLTEASSFSAAKVAHGF